MDKTLEQEVQDRLLSILRANINEGFITDTLPEAGFQQVTFPVFSVRFPSIQNVTAWTPTLDRYTVEAEVVVVIQYGKTLDRRIEDRRLLASLINTVRKIIRFSILERFADLRCFDHFVTTQTSEPDEFGNNLLGGGITFTLPLLVGREQSFGDDTES